MDKGIKQKTILNKKYAMALIQKNFKLIDVQPSIKKQGEIAFIFENSDDLEMEFSILLNEHKYMSGMHGLTLSNIRVLIGTLQGYPITDEDRFPIMETLQKIDDLCCGYQAPVESEEPIEVEQIDKLNIEGLKQSMNGSK